MYRQPSRNAYLIQERINNTAVKINSDVLRILLKINRVYKAKTKEFICTINHNTFNIIANTLQNYLSDWEDVPMCIENLILTLIKDFRSMKNIKKKSLIRSYDLAKKIEDRFKTEYKDKENFYIYIKRVATRIWFTYTDLTTPNFSFLTWFKVMNKKDEIQPAYKFSITGRLYSSEPNIQSLPAFKMDTAGINHLLTLIKDEMFTMTRARGFGADITKGLVIQQIQNDSYESDTRIKDYSIGYLKAMSILSSLLITADDSSTQCIDRFDYKQCEIATLCWLLNIAPINDLYNRIYEQCKFKTEYIFEKKYVKAVVLALLYGGSMNVQVIKGLDIATQRMLNCIVRDAIDAILPEWGELVKKIKDIANNNLSEFNNSRLLIKKNSKGGLKISVGQDSCCMKFSDFAMEITQEQIVSSGLYNIINSINQTYASALFLDKLHYFLEKIDRRFKVKLLSINHDGFILQSPKEHRVEIAEEAIKSMSIAKMGLRLLIDSN